jgi:phage/conjugal plasmid C-4 type zinc finger TraR family protein
MTTMEDDDNAVAASEALIERQTETAIAGIRASLEEAGTDACIVCGEEIEEARREALPSATRCVGCQGLFERRGKH